MPSLEQAAESIGARWLTQWAGRTPTVFESVAGSEPALPSAPLADDAEKVAASWVRLTVRQVLSQQDTLGTTGLRRYERRCIATVQVFTPPNIGTSIARRLAGQAADIFEGVSFAGLTCDTASARELGTDGRWFQTNVDATFRFYETK